MRKMIAASNPVKVRRSLERSRSCPLKAGRPLKSLSAALQRKWTAVRWEPNGSSILFLVDKTRRHNLWRQPLTGEPPTQLTTFTTSELAFRLHPGWKKNCPSARQRFPDVVLIKNFSNKINFSRTLTSAAFPRFAANSHAVHGMVGVEIEREKGRFNVLPQTTLRIFSTGRSSSFLVCSF